MFESVGVRLYVTLSFVATGNLWKLFYYSPKYPNDTYRKQGRKCINGIAEIISKLLWEILARVTSN